MYQIDNATAAETMPTPGASGPNPNGFFTVGNPATSTPATIVDADWLNAVQDELCTAVTVMGGTLAKTNSSQLGGILQSLKTKFGGAGNESSASLETLSTETTFTPTQNCALLLTGFCGAGSTINAFGLTASGGTIVFQYANTGGGGPGLNNMAGITAVINCTMGVPVTLTATMDNALTNSLAVGFTYMEVRL
jgi:hypothetical protein